MNLPPSRELTTEKFDRLPPKLKVQSPKFKRNSRLQAPKSAGAFSLGKTGGHPTTTTEKREETDRGCARSASRSSSAGGVRVGIISPPLGIQACCGWSFGHSGGPGPAAVSSNSIT